MSLGLAALILGAASCAAMFTMEVIKSLGYGRYKLFLELLTIVGVIVLMFYLLNEAIWELTLFQALLVAVVPIIAGVSLGAILGNLAKKFFMA